MSYDSWKLDNPYEGTVTCPNCKEDALPGEYCDECGDYIMTPADIEEARAEERFDAMRDEGLI